MAKAKKKKIFVLDTNVILHDSSCIYKFQENNIILPITVIEELDHFKTGNQTLNYHARQFVRELDSLSGDTIFEEGVSIGEGLGNIILKMDTEFHDDLKGVFEIQKPDHKILNVAYKEAQENPKCDVILVTKDANLRMKAKSIHLIAQDYTNDHVKDIGALYKGHRMIENVDPSLIDRLYSNPFEIDVTELTVEDELMPHEYLILRGGGKSALAKYSPLSGTIKQVQKMPAFGIIPRNAEQTFALEALTNPDVKLVTLSGKAGTGKTLLALAAALESKKQFVQIFLGRPVVPLSNKDLGFLPGDVKSKLDPYMQPIFDNLGVIRNQYNENDKQYKIIQDMQDKNKLVIAPLSYIRGRSLVKIFFIVDEAQNLTPHEVKTIITRAGENTKMIFTGDIFQIDHPYLDMNSNGLSYLIDKMIGQDIYAHINLEKGERSELADLASTLL